MDGVELKSDRDAKIVQKIKEGYVPPIIVVGKMEFQQIIEIVLSEEIANVASIEPQGQIFEELNCSERMMRSLSASIHANGKSDFQNKPSDWEYVPPEGNSATLVKLLCRLP
jgi:hypothetical protein